MALRPRVFVEAAKGLVEPVVKAATNLSSRIVVRPSDAGASWVNTWDVMAGDLGDMEEYDVLVCVAGTPPTLGQMASCSHALFRKRIPVLICAPQSVEADVAAALDAECQALLKIDRCDTEGEIEAAVTSFLTPPAEEGKVFVVDGGDGAGKQTQTGMIVERMKREGYPVRTLDFPRDSAKYGKEIRKVLTGKYGTISEVSPLLFSTLYAMNRNDLRPIIQHWVRKGYNVVLDRYLESNFGHQAAKLETEEEQEKLIKQLDAYETRWLGNPKSNRLVYLDLDPEIALKAMEADTSRKALDIHETARVGYKSAVRRCYLSCAKRFEHWNAVACSGEEGARVPREAVHEQIWGLWQKDFVNRTAP
eukprot:Hpha_TRINITY_DN16750_c0_g1::TRINITY_DN16750_c0_g1_i6::g.79865::m.79865/K00943/tmk, DTYMK; dTMP kinase